MLEKLKIAKYRFVLEPVESMSLPPHKGATLRGGFGQAFKRMTCSRSYAGQPCDECPEQNRCAYSYVFETPVPPDSDVLRTHSAVPRPFVFEPPLDGKTKYRPGDDLAFGLVLIGQAIDYLPCFVLSFKALGETGLGRGRGRFRLRQAWATDPLGPWETLVYDGPSDALRNECITTRISDIERAAALLPRDELAIHFLTPTSLKHAGRIDPEPAFHVLVRALLRRVSSLYYFHCGERWDADYRGLIELAQTAETVEAHTACEHYQRYSSRQRQRIPMGGVTGTVHYAGPLDQFRPLLVLGSLVHVGKACVFGNGRYTVT